MRFCLTLRFVALALCLAGSVVARGAGLVEGNIAFALDLYQQLRSAPGNLFFSPYSISTAMAMTYAGAHGETERQIAAVLHFNTNQAALHLAFRDLQLNLAAMNWYDNKLRIANGLWLAQGQPFLPAFLQLARDYYQAELQQVDFAKPVIVADQINRWIDQKTQGKIQNVITPDLLNPQTALVLVNTIYFKAQWARAFKETATLNQPFYLSDSNTVTAPLMRQRKDFRYFDGSGFQALQLPYRDGPVEMIILLPRKIDGCRQLEQQLTSSMLAEIINRLEGGRSTTVEVFLPRFRLESHIDLEQTLTRMGMADAFTGNADFSGIDGTTGIFISAIKHKAFCQVNENGTEAAAATAIFPSYGGAPRAPATIIFRADHPFLFLVRDRNSGSILFLGRLADPRG